MKQELAIFKLLNGIGIREGQSILDFGCGYGAYTLPIAALAGQYGRVYALDKDRVALDMLMRKSLKAGLTNIVRMETDGKEEIELSDGAIDVVIMFDVLHSFYFPCAERRGIMLDEIHRIMKLSAILCISVWPNLREPEIEAEIEHACFRLVEETPETLTYDPKCSETRLIQIYLREPCAPLALAAANQSWRNYYE